jgi:hypothetical protein
MCVSVGPDKPSRKVSARRRRVRTKAVELQRLSLSLSEQPLMTCKRRMTNEASPDHHEVFSSCITTVEHACARRANATAEERKDDSAGALASLPRRREKLPITSGDGIARRASLPRHGDKQTDTFVRAHARAGASSPSS